MKTKTLGLAVLAIAALAAAGYGGMRYAAHGRMDGAPAPAGAPVAAERKVLYWHDPMFPQQKFDKPGKSPFMDMQLVPVYADTGGEAGPGVSVNATVSQNLGLRFAEAVRGRLEGRLEAVGAVAWNERSVVLVQTRAGGFVEKLHARAPLDAVVKGQPLVEILIPQWGAAQEEFLLLHKRADAQALAAAARQRLVLLGMSEAAIEEVARTGKLRTHFTLHAPISGVIAELGVREGMTVSAGMTLFRIVDLATVWVNAEVPEGRAGSLRPKAKVQARVPAWPDVVFEGSVEAILPEVDPTTRTVRARIALANPGARLKPGMYANLVIAGDAGTDVVLVPSEAVIRTGERNVVIAAEGKRFVVRPVRVGEERGGQSVILEGLAAGTRVVASGQFLIDSEANLKGAVGRLEAVAAAPAAAPAAGATHPGSGQITALDLKKGHIELSHGPMPTINWPAMQMGFSVASPEALKGLAPGEMVEFEMRGEPDKDGNYVIERLKRKAAK